MESVGNPTSDVSQAAATAVTVKNHDQKKVEGANNVRLIESAAAPEAKPLPPDATFSTYA